MKWIEDNQKCRKSDKMGGGEIGEKALHILPSGDHMHRLHYMVYFYYYGLLYHSPLAICDVDLTRSYITASKPHKRVAADPNGEARTVRAWGEPPPPFGTGPLDILQERNMLARPPLIGSM